MIHLDHLNLMALLNNTVPRTIKDNILLEVEEVLMGINLSKVCKARANEVDGIANTVKRYNEDMNVDTSIR